MSTFNPLNTILFTGGKFPFRQIPILEVNGKTLAQARAILRYLAREFGKLITETVSQMHGYYTQLLDLSLPKEH